MDLKLDAKLVKAFPTLYADRNKPMNQTAMCWGFQCGDGWFKLIWDLSKKLEPMVKKWKCPKSLQGSGYECAASTVKEKFGTLRFYMTTSTDEMEAAITEAEKISAKTCEDCGKPGKNQSIGGWWRTVCPACKKSYIKEQTNA